MDSNIVLKFYKRFDTPNQPVSLGIINPGDIAILVGSGELSVINAKLSKS